MTGRTILILGGYGNTGSALARLLLQHTDVCLVLAGRNLDKARAAAFELNRSFTGERVRGICVDAADTGSLRQAFKGIEFVVVASSTTPYVRQITEAALDAGIDYLDVQYSPQKFELLRSYLPRIEQAACCFITDGGFHPGLPAALVRYAAGFFDRLESARVGSVIKIDWRKLSLSDETLYELLELLNDFEVRVFKEGQWKQARLFGMMDYIIMDFGMPFGKQSCVPMFLEELRELPLKYPSLRETGFFVGSFNWFTDWIILPIAMLAMRLSPKRALRPMSRLMRWGLNTFTKPPYGTLLKVEARGRQEGKAKAVDVTLCHDDGYMFTAIPVAACLLQYLDGSIRRSGLWTQGNIVEPTRLMKDMQSMGVAVRVQEQARSVLIPRSRAPG